MKRTYRFLILCLSFLLTTCIEEKEQTFNSLGSLGRPQLVLPKDSIYPIQDLAFEWEINDQKEDYEYKIYVWEEGKEKTEAKSTKDLTFTLKSDKLTTNKVYKWEVVVINPTIGLSNNSIVGTFKTKKVPLILKSIVYPSHNKVSVGDTVKLLGEAFGSSGSNLKLLLDKRDTVIPFSQSDTVLKFKMPQVFRNDLEVLRDYKVGDQSIVERFKFDAQKLADTVFPFLFTKVGIHATKEEEGKATQIEIDFEGEGFGKAFDAQYLNFKSKDHVFSQEEVVQYTDRKVRVKTDLKNVKAGNFSIHYKEFKKAKDVYDFYNVSPGIIRQDQPSKRIVIKGIGLSMLGKQILRISKPGYKWEKKIDQILQDQNGQLNPEVFTFDLDISKSVSGNLNVSIISGKKETSVGYFSVLTQADILKFDRYVLTKIYEENGGILWSKVNPPNQPIVPNKTWIRNLNLNTWAGVSVSADYGIERLDMSGFGLIGKLTDEIKNLESLKSLNLSKNASLRGKLPEQLCERISAKTLQVFAEKTSYNDLCLDINELLSTKSYFLDEEIEVLGKKFINGDVIIRLFHNNDLALSKPLDTLKYETSKFSNTKYAFKLIGNDNQPVYDTTYRAQLVINNRFLNSWADVSINKKPRFVSNLDVGTYYFDRIVRIIGENFPKDIDDINVELLDNGRAIPLQLVTTQFSRKSFSFRLPKQGSYNKETQFGLQLKMYGKSLKKWENVNVASSDVLTNLTNTNIYKTTTLKIKSAYNENRKDPKKFTLVVKDSNTQNEFQGALVGGSISAGFDEIDFGLNFHSTIQSWKRYDIDMRYDNNLLETWTDVSIRDLATVKSTNLGKQVLYVYDTIKFTGNYFPTEPNLTRLIIKNGDFSDTLSTLPFADKSLQYQTEVKFKLDIDIEKLNAKFDIRLLVEDHEIKSYDKKYLLRYPEISGERVTRTTYFQGDDIKVTARNIKFTTNSSDLELPKLDVFKFIIKDEAGPTADTLIATKIQGDNIYFKLDRLKNLGFSSNHDRVIRVEIRGKTITPNSWTDNSFREKSVLASDHKFNKIYYTNDTIFVKITPKRGSEDTQIDFKLISFINGELNSDGVSEYLDPDIIPFKLNSFSADPNLKLAMLFKHDTVFKNKEIELRPSPIVYELSQNYIIQSQVIEVEGRNFIADKSKIKIDFYFDGDANVGRFTNTLVANSKSTATKLYFDAPEDESQLALKTFSKSILYVDGRKIKDFGKFGVKKKPITKQKIRPYYYIGDTIKIDGDFFNTDPDKAFVTLTDKDDSSITHKISSFKVSPKIIYIKVDDRIPEFKSYKLDASHDGIDLAKDLTVDFRKYPVVSNKISQIIYKGTKDTITGLKFPRKGVNTPTPKYVIKYEDNNVEKEIKIPDENVKENYLWFNSDFIRPVSLNNAYDFEYELYLDGRKIKEWKQPFSYRNLPEIQADDFKDEWYVTDPLIFTFKDKTEPSPVDYSKYKVLLTNGDNTAELGLENPQKFKQNWGLVVPNTLNGVYGHKKVKLQVITDHHVIFTKDKVSFLKQPVVSLPIKLQSSYFVKNDLIHVEGSDFLDLNNELKLYKLAHDKVAAMTITSSDVTANSVKFTFGTIPNKQEAFERIDFRQNGRVWRKYTSNFTLIKDPEITSTVNDFYFNSLDTLKLNGQFFPENKSEVTIKLKPKNPSATPYTMSMVKYGDNKLTARFYHTDGGSLIPAGIYKVQFWFQSKVFFESKEINVYSSPAISSDNIPSSRRLYVGDTIELTGTNLELVNYQNTDYTLKISRNTDQSGSLVDLNPIANKGVKDTKLKFRIVDNSAIIDNVQNKVLGLDIQGRKIDWDSQVSIRKVPKITNKAAIDNRYFYEGDTIEFIPHRQYKFPEEGNFNVVNFQFDPADATRKLNFLNPALHKGKWLVRIAKETSPQLDNILQKQAHKPKLLVDGNEIETFNSIRIWKEPETNFLQNLAPYYYNGSNIEINGKYFYADDKYKARPAYLVFHRLGEPVTDTLMVNRDGFTDNKITIKTTTLNKGEVSKNYNKVELFINNRKVGAVDNVTLDTRDVPLIKSKIDPYYFISNTLVVEGEGFKGSAKIVLKPTTSADRKEITSQSLLPNRLTFRLDTYSDGTTIEEQEFTEAVLFVDGSQIGKIDFKDTKKTNFIFAKKPKIQACDFANTFGGRFYVGSEYKIKGTDFFTNSKYVSRESYRLMIKRRAPLADGHSKENYLLIDTILGFNPAETEFNFKIETSELTGDKAKVIDPDKEAQNNIQIFIDSTLIHTCSESVYLRHPIQTVTDDIFSDSSYVYGTDQMLLPKSAWQDKNFPQMEKEDGALKFHFSQTISSQQIHRGTVTPAPFTSVGKEIIIGDYTKVSGIKPSYDEPYTIRLEIDKQNIASWNNIYLIDKLPKGKVPKKVYYLGQTVTIEPAASYSFFGAEYGDKWAFDLYKEKSDGTKEFDRNIPIETKSKSKITFTVPKNFRADFYKDYYFKVKVMTRDIYDDFQPIQFRPSITVTSDWKDNLIKFYQGQDTIKGSNFPTGAFKNDNKIKLVCGSSTPKVLTLDAKSSSTQLIFDWPTDDFSNRKYVEENTSAPDYDCNIEYHVEGHETPLHIEKRLSYRPDPNISVEKKDGKIKVKYDINLRIRYNNPINSIPSTGELRKLKVMINGVAMDLLGSAAINNASYALDGTKYKSRLGYPTNVPFKIYYEEIVDGTTYRTLLFSELADIISD